MCPWCGQAFESGELNGTTLSFREQMVKARTAKSKVDEAKR